MHGYESLQPITFHMELRGFAERFGQTMATLLQDRAEEVTAAVTKAVEAYDLEAAIQREVHTELDKQIKFVAHEASRECGSLLNKLFRDAVREKLQELLEQNDLQT